MIRAAVDRLIGTLGELDAEQAVYAATARRLADLLDGDDAPGYAMPPLARELRAAVAALTEGLRADQGVSEDDLDRLLRGGIG